MKKVDDKDKPVEFVIHVEFTPSHIGPEREKEIWVAIAGLMMVVTTEAEQKQLLDRMQKHKGGRFRFSAKKKLPKAKQKVV